MSKKSYIAPAFAIGGGLATVGFILAMRRANKTVDAVKKAISGETPSVAVPGVPGVGVPVQLRLTGYWPFQSGLSAAGRKMEGGVNDRAGKPLHTVEDFFAGKSDHVSLSGDDAIWPYGQKVLIPWTEGRTIVGRVTDTGGHFRGAGKIIRVSGYEPIDVCVASADTKVPKLVTAQIVPGDNLAKKGLKEVAEGKLAQHQVAGEPVEARTVLDHAALGRALASELEGRPYDEMVAAGWAMRNRADYFGLSVVDLLAPHGKFGSCEQSGGYASTRRSETPKTMIIADDVLKSSKDPTSGAIDFWVPEQQDRMRALGDVYRAAVASGDTQKAARYARYASYGTEQDVRDQQTRAGLRVCDVVGAVELLRKV